MATTRRVRGWVLGVLTALQLSHLLSSEGRAVASDSGVLPSVPVANSEDVAAPENARWVLASSMASGDIRSALYAIRKSTLQTVQLYPAAGETALPAIPLDAPSRPVTACSAEPLAHEYSGHGVAFRAQSGDAGTLYVVNHGRGETIEIFRVSRLRSNRAPPRLVWLGCVPLPPGTVGNAVTVTPDGQLFATITPVENGAPQLAGVRSWTSSEGWSAVPGSSLRIPTGIALAPDGHRLYVSSFVDRIVREIPLNSPGTTVREVAVPFGPDNLTWTRDGALLVGGLDGGIVDIMRACGATSDPRCAFPGFVARIDPAPLTITCTVGLGDTTTTSATQVDGALWLGSSRSRRIWRATANVLARCPHQIDVRN